MRQGWSTLTSSPPLSWGERQTSRQSPTTQPAQRHRSENIHNRLSTKMSSGEYCSQLDRERNSKLFFAESAVFYPASLSLSPVSSTSVFSPLSLLLSPHSLSLTVYLSVSMYLDLSVYLYILYVSISLYICLSPFSLPCPNFDVSFLLPLCLFSISAYLYFFFAVSTSL